MNHHFKVKRCFILVVIFLFSCSSHQKALTPETDAEAQCRNLVRGESKKGNLATFEDIKKLVNSGEGNWVLSEFAVFQRVQFEGKTVAAGFRALRLSDGAIESKSDIDLTMLCKTGIGSYNMGVSIPTDFSAPSGDVGRLMRGELQTSAEESTDHHFHVFLGDSSSNYLEELKTGLTRRNKNLYYDLFVNSETEFIISMEGEFDHHIMQGRFLQLFQFDLIKK